MLLEVVQEVHHNLRAKWDGVFLHKRRHTPQLWHLCADRQLWEKSTERGSRVADHYLWREPTDGLRSERSTGTKELQPEL